MKPFANLHDGGVQLAEQLLAATLFADVDAITIAPIMPNGVPVALGLIEQLRSQGGPAVRIEPIHVERTHDGVSITEVPRSRDVVVVVVDDGVETGTAALAAGRALRSDRGAGLGDQHLHLVLAVPVCPHQAIPDLTRIFDAVVAVHRPMGRRSLSWHYVDFDLIDLPKACELLKEYGGNN
ncbi:MAG: hypothetical protein ACKOW5_05850 [Actinomycetales bacterium]